MKKLLIFVAALLLSVAVMGTSLAEYGYTDVSQIPMAVDFTFQVEFDKVGLPYIVTDYPYKTTGAVEMTLTYNKGEYESVPLIYNFADDQTFIGHSYSEGYDTIPDDYAAAKEILDGTLTLDDHILINTTNYGPEVDWYLTYSISQKAYVKYDELTFAQSFHSMDPGGVEKSIFYDNGKLTESKIYKRINKGDLCICYDKNGDISSAYVSLNTKNYIDEYDKSTGLFNGQKLSELGFSDSDIDMPAPAAIGQQTDPDKVEAFITRCYQNILGRKPDADELSTWRKDLSSGQKTAAQIADQFAGSAEFRSRKLSFADMVEGLCQAMLNRPAEPAEKAEWINMLKQGKRLKSVLSSICKSDEYVSLCETTGIEPGMVYVPVIIKK